MNSGYTDSGLSDSGSKDAVKGNAAYRNAAKRNGFIVMSHCWEKPRHSHFPLYGLQQVMIRVVHLMF